MTTIQYWGLITIKFATDGTVCKDLEKTWTFTVQVPDSAAATSVKLLQNKNLHNL